jgi:hypothetical protein
MLADWLEESGSPADAAWVDYLRGSAGGDRRPIRAKLAIPAERILREGKSLLPFRRILPAANITLEIGDADVPRAIVELMPESVARENVWMPIEIVDRTLVVVALDPHPDLMEKLEFILARKAVAFRGERDDILAAIDRHYGQANTESVDCVSYESPLIGLQGDTGEIFVLFHTAFESDATGFEMQLSDEACTVRYIRANGLSEAETYSVSTFDRLLAHCLEEGATASHDLANGLNCRDFDVPLLSGRRFPVTLEWKLPESHLNRLRGRRPNWFRLRFCWERREPPP